MGQNLCSQTPQDNDLSLDPLSSSFKQTQPFQITSQINTLISKIKALRPQIIDPRLNHQLNYYQSHKYPFKLKGNIKSKRPVGQCLFFFDHQDIQNNYDSKQKESKQTAINDDKENPSFQQKSSLINKKYPLLITTLISPHYTFSPHTLIIYHDHSYYIGEIMAKKYQAPKATGQGLLVTKDFIYEGEFDDGFPQGYGRYRTKSLQYTGWIKKGIPSGQCIQKSSQGMFVGKMDQSKKVGYLITPQNKRLQIHQTVSNQTQLNI